MQSDTPKPPNPKLMTGIGWACRIFGGIGSRDGRRHEFAASARGARRHDQVRLRHQRCPTDRNCRLGRRSLYLIPQTSVLGAILITGYLGSSCHTTVRVNDAFAAVIAGVLVWLGLYSAMRPSGPWCR